MSGNSTSDTSTCTDGVYPADDCPYCQWLDESPMGPGPCSDHDSDEDNDQVRLAGFTVNVDDLDRLVGFRVEALHAKVAGIEVSTHITVKLRVDVDIGDVGPKGRVVEEWPLLATVLSEVTDDDNTPLKADAAKEYGGGAFSVVIWHLPPDKRDVPMTPRLHSKRARFHGKVTATVSKVEDEPARAVVTLLLRSTGGEWCPLLINDAPNLHGKEVWVDIEPVQLDLGVAPDVRQPGADNLAGQEPLGLGD